VKLCQETLDVPEILNRLEKLEKGILQTPSPKSAPIPVSKSTAPQSPPVPLLKREIPSTQVPIFKEAIASDSSVPALDQAWPKILLRVQNEKPSLYPTLEQAQPSWNGEAAELSFAKQFSLENAKRNSAFLEDVIAAELNKKVSLTFKLLTSPLIKPPAATLLSNHDEDGASLEDDDTEVVEPLHSTFEALDKGETFEPIEGTPSPVEDALEDEGAKKFLKIFHGKVSRPSIS